MHILWMLIIGLVIGAIAKLIMPGRDPGGILITMLLGVAGSLIAGFLGRALGWYNANEGAGFIASVIGAVLLLAIYRAVIGRRHVTV
ncbi:MAG TPA: GlsB/YeaQ/YmgE family stress response membrane protein [Kofleriaceae bacterium]|nr:GlsB/YeaQ/YmgE family stress response membrane protein [Kofleriaceae bacterium]